MTPCGLCGGTGLFGAVIMTDQRPGELPCVACRRDDVWWASAEGLRALARELEGYPKQTAVSATYARFAAIRVLRALAEKVPA